MDKFLSSKNYGITKKLQKKFKKQKIPKNL